MCCAQTSHPQKLMGFSIAAFLGSKIGRQQTGEWRKSGRNNLKNKAAQQIRFNAIICMWEPAKFLEPSLQPNWWRIPRKHLKPQLLKKQENPDMQSPTLKSRWFPSCQLLVIPRKNNNKGTKSSFCALPWSCSSLQSSTFGLSSSVPLINHRGGAGRGQLWLPHPLSSPALLAPSPWSDTTGARQLSHHLWEFRA